LEKVQILSRKCRIGRKNVGKQKDLNRLSPMNSGLIILDPLTNPVE